MAQRALSLIQADIQALIQQGMDGTLSAAEVASKQVPLLEEAQKAQQDDAETLAAKAIHRAQVIGILHQEANLILKNPEGGYQVQKTLRNMNNNVTNLKAVHSGELAEMSGMWQVRPYDLRRIGIRID